MLTSTNKMLLSQEEYGIWCCRIDDIVQDVNLGTIETVDDAALAFVQVLFEMLECDHSFQTYVEVRNEVLNAEPLESRARIILAPYY